MELPHLSYTVQHPQRTPMAGVATHAVREECLCEDRKRTEGSLGRCTWLTPAAALAVDLLHCRPSGIKQKHCDTFSTLAGSTGSSPASVSPSPSSVIHIHKIHNPISTAESIFLINLLIKKTKQNILTSLLISHCRLYMQSSFLLRHR